MPTKINLHSISTAINKHVWLDRNTRPLNNAPNGWNIIICKRDTHRHIVCMIYLLFSWKKIKLLSKQQTCFCQKTEWSQSKGQCCVLGESFLCFNKNFLAIYRVVNSCVFFYVCCWFPFSTMDFFIIILGFFFVVSVFPTQPLAIFMCAEIWIAEEIFNVVIIFEFIFFHKSFAFQNLCVFVRLFFYIQISFFLGAFLLEGYSREIYESFVIIMHDY